MRHVPAKPLKVYADTSVFGGVFDVEFQRISRLFLECARRNQFLLLTSELVVEEISSAPSRVQALFAGIEPDCLFVPLSRDALMLRNAYVEASIVTPKSLADALHVAVATVAQADVIVSWNFRHIVHFQKVPLYNAVNRLKGYGEISINSPAEVMPLDEDENL